MAAIMPEPVGVLHALLSPDVCSQSALAFDPRVLLPRLHGTLLTEVVLARLGPAALVNLDQCFLRHQHPPGAGPPRVPPHSWHQDGALGHDFSLAPQADGGLLEMLTCWIALTPCGADRAPALEWVAPSPARLLSPPELTDDAVRAAFGGRIVAAGPLEPGDALVFDGTLLHRTSGNAAMRHERKSAELRFFAAVPPRLAGQRFVALSEGDRPRG